MTKNITLMEDELVTIGIGIPVLETRRFQMAGDNVMKRVNYGVRVSAGSTPKVEIENAEISNDAQFMLNYLSRLTRLIQTSYPEVVENIKVQTPLTSQHWWKAVEGEAIAASAE